MDDADRMRGVDCVRDLLHNCTDFVGGQRSLSLRVFLEDLAGGPLDCEEVQTGTGFADFDRAHDIRVLHALAVTSLAKKPRDRGAILAQFVAQNLYGNGAVVCMLCAENGGRSALTHFALK